MMFILYVNSSCPRGRSSFPTNSQTKVATGSSITSYVCTYIHTYIHTSTCCTGTQPILKNAHSPKSI